jgi:uncharacterized membrane protein YbhN (UPF0104 family)
MLRVLNQLRRYSPLIGVLLLVLLATQVDFREAWSLARAIPLSALPAAAAAYAANVILKAYRWHRMVREQGIRIPLSVSVAAFLSGALYGMLTIGRLGELLRVEALVEHSRSKGRALASCVADRLLDVAFLGTAAGVAAVVALGYPLREALIWFSVAGLGIVALGALFRASRGSEQSSPTHPWGLWLVQHAAKWPFLSRILGGSRDLVVGVLELLFGFGVFEALLWTAVSWFGYFWSVHLLGAALGLHVPFLATVAASAVGAASAALPISFQGIGTREIAFAVVMAPYGVNTTQAMTLSVVTLSLLYVVTLPLGACGIWLRRRQTAASEGSSLGPRA